MSDKLVDKKAIGLAIKEHIARFGRGRDEYARLHRIELSTLNKMVTGVFSLAGLVKLETNTRISFRRGVASFDQASENLGSYLRSGYVHYEGHYSLVRQAFENEDNICLYPVKVEWDESHPGLRIDNTHTDIRKAGYIAIPKNSPYLFIQTSDLGWMSLMVFSTLDVEDDLQGTLMTVGRIGEGTYAPFSVPVMLIKKKNSHQKQELKEGDIGYTDLRKRLDAIVTKQFVRSRTKK